jgi:NTE family protein
VKNLTDHPGGFALGLALSGGGARGFAHLGVLKALEENRQAPDIISGVSAGAIVGAFYADGYSPDEILEMFIEKNLFKLIHLTVPKNGFLKPSVINELIKENLKAEKFEELQIPLFLAVTNLNKGKVVYFNKGKLSEKILASASIPVLFEPKSIGGQKYVDGGVFDNLPVKPLENKCKKIIGVNVNPLYEDNDLEGILKLAERTFYLNIVAKIQENIPKCDLFIEPHELKGFGLFEVSKAREIFEIGYKAALRALTTL